MSGCWVSVECLLWLREEWSVMMLQKELRESFFKAMAESDKLRTCCQVKYRLELCEIPLGREQLSSWIILPVLMLHFCAADRPNNNYWWLSMNGSWCYYIQQLITTLQYWPYIVQTLLMLPNHNKLLNVAYIRHMMSIWRNSFTLTLSIIILFK